jgi:hypothetical protein
VHSRSTCTKPVAVAPGRAVGGLAGRRRCTAARGAGCMGVRPALAGLRAPTRQCSRPLAARRYLLPEPG